MKKKMFLLLIAVMSLSLIGIIFVQVYWIQKTIAAKEARFSFNARQSLLTVAEEAKNNELDKWYVKFASLADSIKIPDKTKFTQLFQVKKNNLTNETFYITNSILQQDYKVRSELPGFGGDSVNFKKLVNRKVTLVREENLEEEVGLSSRKRWEKVTRLDHAERRLLTDQINRITDKLPVYKRISQSELKQMIDKQLNRRGVKSDYEFGIYSRGLATKVSTAGFSLGSPATYGISIFPSHNTDYKLYINFTDKQKEIYSSVVWMATLSIAFTIIIILAYAGAIYQLLKQRRIAEIKNDFINNMTHEFKTPIATINLALDSVGNETILKNPDRIKDYLKMIRDENHRMHAQVENVLRISRLERNELDLKKERLILHDLIKDAITHVSLIVENRGGYIQTHFAALKSSILANESHFISVLVNILDNAVKYSEDSPKIDIYTENVKNYLIVKIRDQGNGMSKGVQKKIFEKFYREHTGDLHNVKGHGLGLAYVQKIVLDHQGEISVESEKGKGSTFIIKLPLIS